MKQMKLKNGKIKLNENIKNMKKINTYMIFNDLKQSDILVIVFILVNLIQLKLIWIKEIYQKIWQNLTINHDQKQRR